MRTPSFRLVLALNQAPIAVFSIVILGVTIAVLGQSAARIDLLEHRLAAGTLTQADLRQAGTDLQLVWIASLAAFGVFAVTASGLSVYVYRHVATRAQRLARFLTARTEGREDDVERPAVHGDDALAELERSVIGVADDIADRDRHLEEQHRRTQFDARLQRALDLADSEDEALDVATRALEMLFGTTPFEILLADSSDAHLRMAAGSRTERPGCPVGCPKDCAAIRRGQTLSFTSSDDLDACPKLRHRGGDALSALCTPLTVMGRTIGVLHVTGDEGHQHGADQVALFEAVATHVGGRVSGLRTLASTELRAQTDAMTGLANRRRFEAAATARLRAAPQATDAVVMVDVDHFKRLNDTAGHDAGDRALRLFATVLKGGVRSTDLVARYGGEEFVLLLPDCDEDQARQVLHQIRKRLADAVSRYGGPAFTASFGLTCTDGATPLEELVARADGALYEAKRLGRNRIVATGELAQSDLELASAK